MQTGFRFKTSTNERKILIEGTTDIVTAIHVATFLRKIPITKHPQEGSRRPIISYLAEMWVKQNRPLDKAWKLSNIRGVKAPTGKFEKVNICHIRPCESGFLEG
jgi:hypothetical protein